MGVPVSESPVCEESFSDWGKTRTREKTHGISDNHAVKVKRQLESAAASKVAHTSTSRASTARGAIGLTSLFNPPSSKRS